MATGPSEEKLREMVQQIESKDYKVLTKDEYEALLSLRTMTIFMEISFQY